MTTAYDRSKPVPIDTDDEQLAHRTDLFHLAVIAGSADGCTDEQPDMGWCPADADAEADLTEIETAYVWADLPAGHVGWTVPAWKVPAWLDYREAGEARRATTPAAKEEALLEWVYLGNEPSNPDV